MKKKILAIQGSSLKKINIRTDTTFFLGLEAQKRNYDIYYYEPKDLSFIDGKVIARCSIVKFQNNCFGRIQMSFVENKLHIAIRYSDDIVLFEPRLYTSIVDSNDIQEYYENLTWIGDLVKELNLNRKIWKKS